MNHKELVQRIAKTHFKRKRADFPVSPLSSPQLSKQELKKIKSESAKLISRSIQAQLRRLFTPRGFAFFQYYLSLRMVELGAPVEGSFNEDPYKDYKQVVRKMMRVKSPKDGKKLSPPVLNRVVEFEQEVGRWLRQLSRDGVLGPLQWRKIAQQFGPLIELVCRDKGMYLGAKQIGSTRWTRFTKLRPKAEKIARLQDEDPEAYSAVLRQKKTLADIDERIRQEILMGGMEYTSDFLMGTPVHVGVDKVTGEKSIFTRDGDRIPEREYKDYVIDKRETQAKLTHAEALAGGDLDNLRVYSSDEVEASNGQMKWASLTDDKAKASGLTRIFKTKMMADPQNEYKTKEIIAEGRFQGIPLEDMINSQGRMLEGTEYTFDPLVGKRGRPVRRDPADSEPYVSLSDESPPRLFLRVKGHPKNDEVMKALRAISGNRLNPSGQWYTYQSEVVVPPPGFQATTNMENMRGRGEQHDGFYFTPENFALVRDAIGGMALSEGAANTLEDYFDNLTRAEQATQKENLSAYEPENLGGFRSQLRFPGKDPIQMRLITKQKEALAWLEANEDSGVIALDTGLGKCTKYDTLVVTNKGLVEIQEMNPGISTPDETAPVEGWNVFVNGREMAVKNFYYGGEKPTKLVRTRYGFEIEGSLVHPLLTRTAAGVLDWVRTPDLLSGDYLCIDRSEGVFPEEDCPLAIPTQGFKDSYEVPDKMNPELARLLGYLVAEGCIPTTRRGLRLSQCPEKNPKVRADMEHLLRTQFNWWKDTYEGVKDIQISSAFLKQYVTSLGVEDLSAEKRIPRQVLQGTRETCRQFLRGYLDAEGHVSESHFEWSTASEKLARETQLLLLRFGVVSRISPKKVEGYDQTYYRGTVIGNAFRTFMQKVGLISDRKISAASHILEKEKNTNHDVIPHMSFLVQSLHREIMSRWSGNVSEFRDKYGSSIHNTMNHVRLGRRNATYRFLRELIHVAELSNCANTPSAKLVQEIVDLNYFYDPIETIEDGHTVVMDIEVDDPSHCFVGNGMVNHNTVCAIAMMQKLIRDGWAEEDPDTGQMETNGRFLFVVPKAALKGNITSEVFKFLEAEDATFLADRIDCMTTNQYSRALRSNKAKVTVNKKTVELNPWDPEQYIAVFFDEAHQYLVNPDNKTTRATLAFNHPRKICLTASPLQKEPMDAYVLAAVCNNLDLGDTSTEEGRTNRKNMRTFKRRFCEEVGGRIMGVKNDPIVQRDLNTWVKRNIFYADKTDVEDELPGLSIVTESVTMDPKVEAKYRETSQKILKKLQALTIKFRDKGIIGDAATRLRMQKTVDSKDLEKFGKRDLRPIFKMLADLALQPETVIAGMTIADNPKISRSSELIREQLEVGSKSLLFTDNPKFVSQVARELSKKLPGVHVAAESGSIRFFRSGTELKGWTVTGYVQGQKVSYEHKLPFKPVALRMFPNLPASRNSTENRHFNKADWSQFALREVIQGDLDRFTSLTAYGKAYQSGQNLQGFSTVIHLDRNSWNSENMKQRTARAWRQGQKNPVTEFTLDVRYSDKADADDTTLDEIRNYHQQLEGELFDTIIKDAQEAELGKEWLEMEKRLASFMKVDQKTAELMLSPYLDNV